MIYNNTGNFERFAKEVRKFPKVSHQEQLILFRDYRLNPTKEKETHLFNLNLRLLINFINKWYSEHNQLEDMVSIGGIGLIKAIRNFNPDKGFTFSTFCKPYINNEIMTDFRYNETTIRKKTSVVRDIEKGKLNKISYVSTSTVLGDDNDDTIGDMLTYNNHFFDDLITEPTTFQKETEFWDYIRTIIPKQKHFDIVKAVFSANTVQAGVVKITEYEIAQMYGVSPQAIGQMKRKAFSILRNDEKVYQYWKQNIFNDT